MKFRNIRLQNFASTRERLGMSQSQLAEQLGIAKSTLAMAEIGRRPLPAAALIKFAQMEVNTAAEMARGIPDNNPSSCKLHSAELNKLKELQTDIQIKRLTIKLDGMMLKYEKLEAELHGYNMLNEKLESCTDEGIIITIRYHRDRIINQMKTCNPAEQAMLKNKIAFLSAESNMSRSLRQKFS